MAYEKLVGTPLASHFKLISKQCPSTTKEKEKISNIPHASVVGKVMYAMVWTHLDIAHSMGVVNRFLANPGKEHWNVVKWS